MDPIIGLIGGLGAAGIIYLAKKVGGVIFVKKWGSIISKVYDVIDPIAGQLMTSYGGSEVQQAIQLAVARVADSTLDEADIVAITNYVIAKFNPELAAAKVLDKESEEGIAALELVANVAKLREGISFEALMNIAKSASSLV